MEDDQSSLEFDPNSNQPTAPQWLLISIVGLIAICGLLLFLSGGALTAFSWFNGQQVEATETAAAATAVVNERNQVKNEASEWPLLLFDNFDDNHNDWIDGEIDDEYASIQITIDGAYEWHATAKRDFHWRVWPQSDETTDFYLAVDAQNKGNNVDAQYGLIFRENDDSYFYWEISDTQYYRLFSYVSEWNELIPSTFTDAIRPGETNHLVVVCENNEFKFWINDQFVGQASGNTLSKGRAGVAIGLTHEGEESAIIFDNFELRTLTVEE